MRNQLFAAAVLLGLALPAAAQTTAPAAKATTEKFATFDQLRRQKAPVGPVNVRLTFFLIQGDGFQNDDAEIRPLVVELRKVFKFTGYRLASKSVLQAAIPDEFAEVQQVVNDPDGNSYLIMATMKRPTADGQMYIQVWLYPGSQRTNITLINASVNLSNGKTAILGSALGGKERAAVILAVSPTIEK